MDRKSLNQKGFSVGIAVITLLVIAGLALGGYFVWQHNQRDESRDKNRLETSERQSKQNSDSQSKDDKATLPEGFMLYESQEFGFSFGYPERVGPLAAANLSGRPDKLLYAHSEGIEDAFSPYTEAPLYVKADKNESFVTRGGKYGPILEFIEGEWIVSNKEDGETLNGGYVIGSEYKTTIIRTINEIPVYDFSFSDEECHWAVWVFRLEKATVSITLPSICANEKDPVPQERLKDYDEVTKRVLDTLSID